MVRPALAAMLAALLATPAPAADPPILTPPPGPAPRITGPRVFGVRPGSPLLFTITATGERPRTVDAMGLPDGVTLDGKTGQLSGRIAKPGDYDVSVTVSNAHGAATRTLKLACGETLSLTPQMGWNSWYVWENHVTDGIMRAAADAMVSTGLADHGYSYVCIDDCWAVKPGSPDPMLGGAPRDAQGKVNANGRFPDMNALTAYIHAKGLKAGIYTSPGPLTCANHVGAYEHEAEDVARFVEWEFDFLKYDWCSYGKVAGGKDREAFARPYRKIGEILRKQPRDVVLNLCQYGMGDVWEWGREVGGQSWRTAGDLGLTFEDIPKALFRDGFDVYAEKGLHRFAGPGGWNDPDYLLLGELSNWKGGRAPTPLTPDEQYSHVSLWCLVAAPLFLSGDVTKLDAFTLSLLTNDEVLDVDQDPLGRPARRVAKDGPLEVWARPLFDGATAVGLFNRGDTPARVAAPFADLGLTGPQLVRDLWRQRDLATAAGEFAAEVAPHGVVLLRLAPAAK